MVKINDIPKNKKLVLLYVIIVVELIFLVLFAMLFNTTNIEDYEILLVSNLTIGIIALTIPFVMKDIEKKEKQEEKHLKKKRQEDELRKRIKTVINELKEYFEIISSKDTELPKRNLYIPPQFQFFKFIAKKEPEFLKKLGIDIEFYTSNRGTHFSNLIILNIYKLSGGNQPTLKFINGDVEKEYSYEFLLKEIIENAEKNFSITLDKNLSFVSDNLKTSYISHEKSILHVFRIR